nr:ABC-F family ATP-binding cassette domain-containing protein [Saprospiraceae bacterium]
MVELNNISIIYGDRPVLDQITLSISEGEKVGVIGKNGCGKSTLLKVLAGLQQPDEGSFSLPSETTIGFLHQDIQIDLSPVVRDACKNGLQALKKVEGRLNQIKDKGDRDGNLSEADGLKLAELEEQFRILGGYSQDADAEKILKGLGFSEEDISKKVGELSGGWRMRVELAKILLARPMLILLDEPNNHLDMESIIWLENWLQEYEGTALIVSHDADFLENAGNSILEIANGDAFYFNGKLSKFKDAKKVRAENQLRTFVNQQKEVADRQRTIERFRAKATKAKMAKSMEKQLGKMDLVDKPEEDKTSIKFRFQPPPRSGEIVIKVKDLSKRFGDLKVLEDVNFEIERGEKVSLVGKNGEGKTTFVRLILEELERDRGTVEYGHNVQVGYFAQNQDKLLNGNLTLLEFMEQDCPHDLRSKLRGILGGFLFSNEDVDKKIKVLSGGERSRLAMAKMLLKPFNLLIFDEPTNHLDIPSKEVLKQTIARFEGTVIIVSHDREFLRGLSERTMEFADKKIHEYLGDIDYFLHKKGLENIRDFEKKEKVNAPENETPSNQNTATSEETYQLRKKLNRAISYCERNIEKTEKEIQSIEKKMAVSNFFSTPGAVEIAQKHNDLKKKLKEENQKWDKAVEELDKLEE